MDADTLTGPQMVMVEPEQHHPQLRLPFRFAYLDGKPFHVEHGFVEDPAAFISYVEETAVANGAEWVEDHGVQRLDIYPHHHIELFAMFEELMLSTNEAHFGIDVDCWRDLRLLKYGPGSRGMASHMDYNYGTSPAHPYGRACDKLTFSCTLQDATVGTGLRLSHSIDYSGPAPVEVGDVIMYPGWQVHSVGKTVEGTRVALVGSMGGPPLR